MKTQLEKAMALQALHEGTETFVIPNPWDVGSARVLEALGFQALATTSAGLAFSLGKLDGGVTLEEKIAHCRVLSEATAIPLSTDLENGFGHEPAVVAETILRIAEAGAVGGSIEDYDGTGIYDFDLAVERIAAAAEAARSLDFPFALIGRCENLLRGRKDLDDTIRRLQAYEAAGADVLFAPGLATLDEVRAVVDAVARPVNVLAPMVHGASVAELSEIGVRRISIGGALAHAAYAALIDSAREIDQEGSFDWLAGLSAENDVRRLLKAARRSEA
ncbi:MAG: isocitrate lyase/phosphoenolpyruvate mutase family protein [Acidobacteria bacterium]|nr:MAG: isocitrate lyase/phosphoenolpyruvate mutase family protein [Acidobacteriota bacterium]REK03731.1 MAG: isocitrate lyase/phosphoenolpyruvate mutase family protein [Acidobacteriota bacterium]